MTDHVDSSPDDMDDLELITSALNGHLDPERVEEVRRRLDEDPEFRELAAPVLLTWSVPRHLERKPRPVGELENDWNAFAKRAGIGQPTGGSTGRRWHPLWRRFRIVFLFLLLLPLVPLVSLGLMNLVPTSVWAWIGQRQERVTPPDAASDLPTRRVPYDIGWVSIGYGVQASPEHGTVLSYSEVRRNGKWQLTLDSGTVRIRLAPITERDPSIRRHTVDVRTRAGIVSAGESEFTITARGDTTDIEVHSAGRPSTTGADLPPLSAAVEIERGAESTVYHVPVARGERARIVRDVVPALYRKIP